MAAGGERGVQPDEGDRAERYKDLPPADTSSAAPAPGARDVGGHGDHGAAAPVAADSADVLSYP
ncbi:hypothetical protein GCM10009646_36510 [Streptomyces aureus]